MKTLFLILAFASLAQAQPQAKSKGELISELRESMSSLEKALDSMPLEQIQTTLDQTKETVSNFQRLLDDMGVDRVPAGTCAIIYENENFQGTSFNILANKPVAINGRVSSVAVRHGCKMDLQGFGLESHVSQNVMLLTPQNSTKKLYNYGECTCSPRL